MHDDTDDTIPHVLRAERAVGVAVGGDVAELALAETVMRQPAVPSAGSPTPPPLPAALRPHHRIRVGDDEPLELDRPVHIGRRPRALRVPLAGPPHLVTVASPDGGISSTHLELREQGAVVVATDMRTLNGSAVHVPGSPVHVLRRGESVVVTPGTRIELGEGVVVEVLGPARAAPRGERAS